MLVVAHDGMRCWARSAATMLRTTIPTLETRHAKGVVHAMQGFTVRLLQPWTCGCHLGVGTLHSQ